jgi:hypothetical protein
VKEKQPLVDGGIELGFQLRDEGSMEGEKQGEKQGEEDIEQLIRVEKDEEKEMHQLRRAKAVSDEMLMFKAVSVLVVSLGLLYVYMRYTAHETNASSKHL